MKALVVMFLLSVVLIFAWRHVLNPYQRIVSSRWGRRVLWAAMVAGTVVLGLFSVLSLTSWRLF